jgi:hypothetical protein
LWIGLEVVEFGTVCVDASSPADWLYWKEMGDFQNLLDKASFAVG